MANQNVIKTEKRDDVREYKIDIPAKGLISIVIQEASIFTLEAAILPVYHPRSFQISVNDNGKYAGLVDNNLGGRVYGYLRKDVYEYLHTNLDKLPLSKIPRDKEILERFLDEFNSRRHITY
ncbi:MAG: hypothetical protein AABW41_03380 [Nanoarchaeota archaeon]